MVGHQLIPTLDLRNRSGCREANRRVLLSIPAGGTEASSTAPGAEWVSRYFWITKPPIEWPSRTGGCGIAAATAATSSEYSAIRVQRSRFRPRACPWPRRSMADTAQPRSLK